MKSKYISILILLLAVAAMDVAVIASEYATEAPAGFDTPTLAQNPGSQSISNGIAQPPGDTYALDQTKFEQDHDASTGLGPVFNARACVDCHQNPVSGASSQFTEIRAGHLDKDGNFVAATVPIDDGASTHLPTALSSMTALSSHKRRSTYLTRKTSGPCEPLSTPLGTALSKRLTTTL